jgi:hypothetical protein
MEPFTMVMMGVAIGIVRERIYQANDRGLTGAKMAKFVGRGFFKEIEVLHDLSTGKKRNNVIVIQYPPDMPPERALKIAAQEANIKEESPIKGTIHVEKPTELVPG